MVTKNMILAALTHNGVAWITIPNLGRVILQAARRESGSGNSFILSVTTMSGLAQKVYVRTVD